MTIGTGRHGLRMAAMVATAMALAGCAADYVGDDWQCPLAQGRVCASVAAADPAVSRTRVPETLMPEALMPGTFVPENRGATTLAGETVHGRQGDGRAAAAATAVTAGGPECDSGCDPFAWLGSLFAGIADAGAADAETAVSRRNGDVVTVAPAGAGGTLAAPAPGAGATGSPAQVSAAVAPLDSGDAPPPAEDRAGGGTRADDAPDAPDAAASGALRTGEAVARIWIAPFVDADGVYREGSWVRAVIAPAEWRLP